VGGVPQVKVTKESFFKKLKEILIRHQKSKRRSTNIKGFANKSRGSIVSLE